MTRFLAEIYKYEFINLQFTPSNEYRGLYELSIEEHPIDSYWLKWGGYYDNPTTTNINIYFTKYLEEVNSIQEVINTSYTMMEYDNKIYVNVPKHTWLYLDNKTRTKMLIPFLSAPLDSNNPLSNIFKNNPVSIRLETPDFNIKLSDNINGIVLNQEFNLSLFNDDGLFDDEEKWNIFFTPIILKKSIIDNPTYEDFQTIRNGYIDGITTTFDKIILSCAELLRNLDDDLCKVIRPEQFPNINIREEVINTIIPIVFGQKVFPLIQLNEEEHKYYATDFITNIFDVYDRDGNSIPYEYDEVTGIITAENASSIFLTGYMINKVGEIIHWLITNHTDIKYNSENWNLEEFQDYSFYSPHINILFNSGNVRSAIQSVLKNDVAYLIQQLDGKFTMRKYKQVYKIHDIESWVITKKFEKSWKNATNNYMSSCVITFDNVRDNSPRFYINVEREEELEERYSKKRRRTFNTDLVSMQEAISLSNLLLDRYGNINYTVKVALCIDTSQFNLLDIVYLDLNVNNRAFSKPSYFIIKEINPAQDILTLELIDNPMQVSVDITGEYPNTRTNYYTHEYDGLYHDSKLENYEQIIGGNRQRWQ